MILARVNTGSHEFVALAEDVESATAALYDAAARHCDQNPYADPVFMDEAIADWTEYTEIDLGEVLRDGSKI